MYGPVVRRTKRPKPVPNMKSVGCMARFQIPSTKERRSTTKIAFRTKLPLVSITAMGSPGGTTWFAGERAKGSRYTMSPRCGLIPSGSYSTITCTAGANSSTTAPESGAPSVFSLAPFTFECAPVARGTQISKTCASPSKSGDSSTCPSPSELLPVIIAGSTLDTTFSLWNACTSKDTATPGRMLDLSAGM
eukprot:scaffold1474_cov256-Pinguiococcus_pyrenoidosus.AAC.14